MGKLEHRQQRKGDTARAGKTGRGWLAVAAVQPTCGATQPALLAHPVANSSFVIPLSLQLFPFKLLIGSKRSSSICINTGTQATTYIARGNAFPAAQPRVARGNDTRQAERWRRGWGAHPQQSSNRWQDTPPKKKNFKRRPRQRPLCTGAWAPPPQRGCRPARLPSSAPSADRCVSQRACCWRRKWAEREKEKKKQIRMCCTAEVASFFAEDFFFFLCVRVHAFR